MVIKTKKLYGSFLWMGFNYLKALEPLQGDSLLFTKGNLIFCSMGLTNPNFWQIKIRIMISHINISFSTININKYVMKRNHFVFIIHQVNTHGVSRRWFTETHVQSFKSRALRTITNTTRSMVNWQKKEFLHVALFYDTQSNDSQSIDAQLMHKLCPSLHDMNRLVRKETAYFASKI